MPREPKSRNPASGINAITLQWTGKPALDEDLPNGDDWELTVEQRVTLPTPQTLQTEQTAANQCHANSPQPETQNLLVWGDNLQVMQKLLPTYRGKIALIYVDPPFATGGDMKVRTRGKTPGTTCADRETPRAYQDKWAHGKATLLTLLLRRFRCMRELLADQGVLFAHFDDNLGHEVKLLLDEVFGPHNRRGEIVWKLGTGAKSRKFISIQHNYIWVYSKTAHWVFNPKAPQLREPFAQSSLQTHFRNVDSNGRRYRRRRIGGKEYVYYADEGRALGSVWTDISPMVANSPIMQESTGYPTQKPERLMDRILAACTREGDLVADFYCGSGTTLVAAQRLGLRWIGCDSGKWAIQTSRKRLLDQVVANVIPQGKGRQRGFDMLTLRKRAASSNIPILEAQDESRRLLALFGAMALQGRKHWGRKGETLVVAWPRFEPLDRGFVQQAVRQARQQAPQQAEQQARQQALGELVVLAHRYDPGPHAPWLSEMLETTGVRVRLVRVQHGPVEDETEHGKETFAELWEPSVELRRPTSRTVQLALGQSAAPGQGASARAGQDEVDGWVVDWDCARVFTARWWSHRHRGRDGAPLQTVTPEFVYDHEGTHRVVVKAVSCDGEEATLEFVCEAGKRGE